MSVPLDLLVGAGVHALIGCGIFFARGAPQKVQIFLATIVMGLLVALLIGISLRVSGTFLTGALCGLLYGFAFGFVVVLAKGANFKATPHFPSGSVVQEVLTRILVAKFAAP